MHTTLRFPMLILASAALAACATSGPKQAAADPKRPGDWKVEPVLSVKHAENGSKGYYTLGRYYDGMRAWDKSIEAYGKSIAADPTNVEAHNALGAALAQRRRLDESEAAFRRALALDADLAHVQSNLGYVLMLAGKSQAAVAALKVAVRLDPNNATSRMNLREALAQWDLARGREPEGKPVVVADAAPSTAPTSTEVATTTPATNEAPIQSTAALPVTQATAAPSLPTTIEVMRPITTATLQAPLTTTTVAAVASSTTVASASVVPTEGPNTIEVPRPITSVQAATQSAPITVSQPVALSATPALAGGATDADAPATALAAGSTQVPAESMSRENGLPPTTSLADVRANLRPAPAARPTRVPITQGAERTLRVISEPTVPALARVGMVASLSLGAVPAPRTVLEPTSRVDPAASRLPTHERPLDASAQPAAMAPVQREARPASPVRFEVLNGNGIAGAARRTGDWLARHGLATASIGNDSSFGHQKTVVYYQVGHREDALRVARSLPVKAEIRWARNVPMSQDVRVVLGRDWQTMAMCLARNDCAKKTSTAVAGTTRQ